MVYEVFNVKNETYDLMRNKRTLHKKLESTKRNNITKSSDEEEETTIDDVIQELRNIVNDAESEQYAKDRHVYNDGRSSNRSSIGKCHQTSEINVSIKGMECLKHRDVEREDSVTSTKHSIHITDSTEFLNELKDDDDDETEIIPSKIMPHPPRKSKSLIHLFPPADQGLVYNKPPPDIYDEHFYSSDEGSDSLLSSSRCRNKVSKKPSGSSFDFQECRAIFSTLADGHRKDDELRRSVSRSRDECRRPSVKRSESFQASEKGTRQREYIDSLFYNDHASPLQRSASKNSSRVDEIVNLIESKKLTKSLDRIDEGLNSMVDIVMMAEPKKNGWPYRQRSSSRTNSDTGNETPLIAVTKSASVLNYQHQRYDSRSSKKDDSPLIKSDSPHKFYTPLTKLSSGSFDNHSGSNYNNSSFLVKRGHTNAGFYSGNPIMRDAPASMTSLVMTGTHSHADLKRTLSPIGHNSYMGIPKVTDMPSGLY